MLMTLQESDRVLQVFIFFDEVSKGQEDEKERWSVSKGRVYWIQKETTRPAEAGEVCRVRAKTNGVGMCWSRSITTVKKKLLAAFHAAGEIPEDAFAGREERIGDPALLIDDAVDGMIGTLPQIAIDGGSHGCQPQEIRGDLHTTGM